MVTYQEEMLWEVMPQVEVLLELHYQELTLNKEAVKLKPMWEKYALLESMGIFHVFTARQDGILVGYSAFFVMQNMHYKDTMMGVNDVLYLHPDSRKGTTGIKLIKYSESMLKKIGVNKVVWHIKLNTKEGDRKDFRKIMNRLGYTDEEAVVGKLI